MKRTSSLALAGTLALLAVAVARADEPWPLIAPPIILRLEGSFRPTREAARKDGFAALSVGFSGGESVQRWFAVDDARTVGVDTPLDGKDVLADLAPLWPNMVITGPSATVESMARLPDGARVRMEALVRRGSRTFYLRSFELLSPQSGWRPRIVPWRADTVESSTRPSS